MKRILAGVSATALIVGATMLMPVQTKPQPASAAQPGFDHSNCQYPDRWSNPATGCDNSDPAVPECIKAFSTQQGEADCIAAFVAAQQPVSNPTTPTSQELKQPVNQCGGAK